MADMPGMRLHIIVKALKKAGDDRVKLRDEIEKTKKFVGIGGIFNLLAQPTMTG